MTKWKLLFSIVVFTIVFCGLCGFVSRLTWAKCINGIYIDSSPCPPDRNVHSIDLLIDETAFPSAWHSRNRASSEITPPMFGVRQTQEEASIGFGPIEFTSPTSGAGQFIDRYFTIGQAKTRYQIKKESATRPVLALSKWEHNPDDISFTSEVADEFHIACTHSDTNEVSKCIFIARYDEYVVKFNLIAVSGIWSSGDLNFSQILKAIDEKIEAKLY